MACDKNCDKSKCKRVDTELQCRATAELCDEILDDLNVPDPVDEKAISSLLSNDSTPIIDERGEAE